MFSKWTFGKRLAAGFGLAAVVLFAVVALTYSNTQKLIENEKWVAHTETVRFTIADLLADLLQAESAARGYVVTGDEAYVATHKSTLDAIKANLGELRTLTLDNARQQQRWVALERLIDAKITRLDEIIDARKKSGFESAQRAVVSNAGMDLMDQIQALIGQANDDEQTLLAKRSEEAHASAYLMTNVIVWGGLAGMVAVVGIGWFITGALTRQIGMAAGQVQSSSAELQAAANQQATGAKEQATAMNEISTTISELLATSRQIAESVRRVAETAEQTAVAARSGHGAVDTTHESIAGIRRQVDQVVTHMLELGKKSQEIGSVLDIVSELAEQTNILAINATIEAVGAGETGKRFAVVADEIRKLADRVGGSTKEIRTLIDDVRSAVNTTVMATETGSKAVDTGSRQFGDVASLFKQISNLVLTATEAAREIELSTKQQTVAVEQVNVAIANVAQASKESESSAGQTFQTVSQLATLSTSLLRIVRPQIAA